MERKRKLPPRAAARNEQVSKKRSTISPESSATPATKEPSPVPVKTIPNEPELPTSVQSGNPLPTVEKAQTTDLPHGEYQSIQESGVLAESLTRSRQKWIHEGIFEKYWSKPSKRKGVVKEEPNNPAKDTMTKIGQITITVEPHVFDAVMYAIKDPKAPSNATKSASRPVMQYGPPNGVMPPPPNPNTPAATSQDPAPTTSDSAPTASISNSVTTPALAAPSPQPPTPSSRPEARPAQSPMQQPPAISSDAQAPRPAEPPRAPPATPSTGLESVLAAPRQSPVPTIAPTTTATPSITPLSNPAIAPPQRPPTQGHTPTTSTMHPGAGAGESGAQQAPKPAPPGRVPESNDPIIVALAEQAAREPGLRDLMSRVAVGEASAPELAHFQRVIDNLTNEHRKAGGGQQQQQTSAAEKLMVDGKSVQWFADEVRSIIDIILTSNPKQKSANLRVPPGSDPLVIRLVKSALDSQYVRGLVKRIAERSIKLNDPTALERELNAHLAGLRRDVRVAGSQPWPEQNGTMNNNTQRKPSASSSSTPAANTATPQQALRSKGPPPSLKPDIAGVVLEFPGGSGDRYLFPKYSILEYPSNFEVIASFLLVRKGSISEYGGDPTIDYYQPITIRINSPSGKHLENFAKIVAPQDEVRRYMDDIMSNMTRAEYILLAMRLPKADKEEEGEKEATQPPASNGTQNILQQPTPQGVLWATKSTTAAPPKAVSKVLGEDETYQNFITSIS